jgi:hypothetical protein
LGDPEETGDVDAGGVGDEIVVAGLLVGAGVLEAELGMHWL